MNVFFITCYNIFCIAFTPMTHPLNGVNCSFASRGEHGYRRRVGCWAYAMRWHRNRAIYHAARRVLASASGD